MSTSFVAISILYYVLTKEERNGKIIAQFLSPASILLPVVKRHYVLLHEMVGVAIWCKLCMEVSRKTLGLF